MDEVKTWLVLLPLVLALVKFSEWLRAQVVKHLNDWVDERIDKKLEAQKEALTKRLEDTDFALREELQKLTLKLADEDAKTLKEDHEPRIREVETRTDFL